MVTFVGTLYSFLVVGVNEEMAGVLLIWDWQTDEVYRKTAAGVVMVISGFFTLPLS